jgi:hypothetical protein
MVAETKKFESHLFRRSCTTRSAQSSIVKHETSAQYRYKPSYPNVFRYLVFRAFILIIPPTEKPLKPESETWQPSRYPSDQPLQAHVSPQQHASLIDLLSEISPSGSHSANPEPSATFPFLPHEQPTHDILLNFLHSHPRPQLSPLALKTQP